jgi:hypothetical protein
VVTWIPTWWIPPAGKIYTTSVPCASLNFPSALRSQRVTRILSAGVQRLVRTVGLPRQTEEAVKSTVSAVARYPITNPIQARTRIFDVDFILMQASPKPRKVKGSVLFFDIGFWVSGFEFRVK